MAEENLHKTILAGEGEHKHLALTKVIKINLNKDIDDHETIEYSPAYLNTSCLTNSGSEQNVQFQITSKFFETVKYRMFIISNFI